MQTFQDVIKEKINALEESNARVRRLLVDPNFHTVRIKEVMDNVKSQVQEYEGEFEDLQVEFVSVCEKVPDMVRSTWLETQESVNQISSELRRWNEMLKLYETWAIENAPEDEELIEAVKAGDVPEPSTRTGIRRKPGTKPPISLGKHRRISSAPESGEDSEA